MMKSSVSPTDRGYMECAPASAGPLMPPVQPGSNGPLRSAIAWMTASRSHRVICVLMGLWLINLFDLVLTVLAHGQGVLDESNPIARVILPLGPIALATFKVILVGGASAVLLYSRRQLLAEVTAIFTFLVYIGVAVQWKVCYEMYAISATNSFTPAELERLEALSSGIPIL